MKRSLCILFLLTMTCFMKTSSANNLDKATFAGGCFWCMVHPFDGLPGVSEVISGYAGGTGVNPNYGNYAEKNYVEAIQITYDPSKISYPKLLEIYWKQIDPTDAGGQFVDRGPQYRSVVYYHNAQQQKLAQESKSELGKSGKFDKPIATEITAFTNFYKAEDYHQYFYKRHPYKYKYYRFRSGRDQYLDKVWGSNRIK